MNKKIFITLLIFSLFLFFSYSCCLANTKAGNTMKDMGNSVGNAIVGAKNTVVDGIKDLGNTATTMGKDAMNTTQDLGQDTENTLNDTINNLDTNDNNYSATRTATNNGNLLGMSDTTWTWLILGIVGLAIVGLVWYYGAQYEHRNYND